MIPLPHPKAKSSRKRPLVLWALILLNALCFLVEIERGAGVIRAYALVPGARELHAIPTLLTHMFLHGGVVHLLGNLWFLWLFGARVEGHLGHARFLGFYLVCGVLAGLLHVASGPGSMVPLIGASGAISGVMGAFLRLFPGERMRTLLVVIPVESPAWRMIAVWAGLQVWNAFSSLTAGAEGVAFWAHVGGFAAGFCWMSAMAGSRRRG